MGEIRHFTIISCAGFWWLFAATLACADPPRHMPDIKQDARPEWGRNWCAPAAVGNSFLWLSAQYNIPQLVHENGNGDLMTGEDVVEDVGIAMGTDPDKGTTGNQIETGKNDYLRDHQLAGTIFVERKRDPTKKWLKEQYAAGQDVEMAYGYFEQQPDGRWKRLGTGHTELYGELPGMDAGGHIVSIVSLFDPLNNDADTDFQVTFTDPGRDDLAGQFGCIASEQYVVNDPTGTPIQCIASTYNVRFVLDFFGPGQNAYVLDGYTGLENGLGGRAPVVKAVLEDGFAESLPEPAVWPVLCAVAASLGSRRGLNRQTVTYRRSPHWPGH